MRLVIVPVPMKLCILQSSREKPQPFMQWERSSTYGIQQTVDRCLYRSTISICWITSQKVERAGSRIFCQRPIRLMIMGNLS